MAKVESKDAKVIAQAGIQVLSEWMPHLKTITSDWILRSKFTSISPQSLPLKRDCCC